MRSAASLPKRNRLIRRAEYHYVKANAATPSIKGKYLYVTYCETDGNEPKLGICATKKFGNAVKRNIFKRQVREAFRKNRTRLPKGFSCIISPRRMAFGCRSSDIEEEFIRILC